MVNDYWLVPTWVIIIIWIHPWYIAIILGNFPMCLAKHRSTTPHLSRCGTPWGDLADVPGLVVVIGGEDFGISFAERLLSFGQKTGLQEIHRRKDGGCSIAMFDYQRVVPEKPSTSQDCRRGWLQKETWEVYIYIYHCRYQSSLHCSAWRLLSMDWFCWENLLQETIDFPISNMGLSCKIVPETNPLIL